MKIPKENQRGRAPSTGLTPIPCEVCGSVFQPYRNHQTACSRSCQAKAPKKDYPWLKEREVTCKYCSEVFTVKTNSGKHAYCPHCKPLAVQHSKARKNTARSVAANPHAKAKNMRTNLSRYGLTPEGLAAMQAAQGNRCAICGDPPDPNGVRAASRLHVDHCHGTNRNRGLLCIRCNTGIGHFREDPALFLAAVEYLKVHANESA